MRRASVTSLEQVGCALLRRAAGVARRHRRALHGAATAFPPAPERPVELHEISGNGGLRIRERHLVLLFGALRIEDIDEARHAALIALRASKRALRLAVTAVSSDARRAWSAP